MESVPISPWKGELILRCAFTFFTVALVLPNLLGADDAPKGQDKELDGEWGMESVVFDGKEQPLPRGGKQVMAFRGDALTITLKDVTRKYAITADPSKTPKMLDVTEKDDADKGNTLPGLYEVKGNELRL